jgi:tetrahydromethanopterin S-methyltransferase subunit E
MTGVGGIAETFDTWLSRVNDALAADRLGVMVIVVAVIITTLLAWRLRSDWHRASKSEQYWGNR